MKELETKRNKLVTKSFYLVFEIIFIFGIPAMIAVFVGNWIGREAGSGKGLVYALLAGAFVLSWVIFLLRVKKIASGIKSAEHELRKSVDESK